MYNCLDIIYTILKQVHDANTELVVNMTHPNMSYNYVCIKPNITYDYHYEYLKNRWEKTINDYVNHSDKCPSAIQSMLFMYELENKLKLKHELETFTKMNQSLSDEQMRQIVEKKMLTLAKDIINSTSSQNFVMEKNVVKTLKNLANMLSDNCNCQIIDIFSFIVNKYKTKYQQKFSGKSNDEIDEIIKADFYYVKNLLQKFGKRIDSSNVGQNMNDKTNISVDIPDFNFSIEHELDILIPDDLGTMKTFFIKVISAYFNNIHPIIWVQVFRSMINDIFIALPITRDDFFRFASKHLLLNSGPFVLKILQMIRPILSDDVASKYNLSKLTYPLLEQNQVDIILKRCLVNYDMTKIIYNKSASVGHVCIAYNVRNIDDKYVIKIIKPLAIAQSCWEYDVLKNVFPNDSCETEFIKNILKSNGHEMNVKNEISNLDICQKYYPATYKQEFNIDIDVKLDTIQYKKNIIKDNVWYALAMTLAPGIPVSDLVETNILNEDTRYRAILHRGLDLLVSRFFRTLVSTGLYHGDLHAGNIFFSYKRKQLTLIDFGAIGKLDLTTNTETTKKLLTIVIMSIFYNYDAILDILTAILNDKCTDDPNSIIDTRSQEYIQFKDQLLTEKVKNIIGSTRESLNSKKYIDYINSDKRVHLEKNAHSKTLHSIRNIDESADNYSIYDYLEIIPESKEIVVENDTRLPVYTEILGESTATTFSQILQKIITFYAKTNVNVAIKFAEFNEFQKAYSLLLGVLAKTGYSSYRMSMAIQTGIVNWSNATKLITAPLVGWSIASTYSDESAKYYKSKECMMVKAHFMNKFTNESQKYESLKKCMISEDKLKKIFSAKLKS